MRFKKSLIWQNITVVVGNGDIFNKKKRKVMHMKFKEFDLDLNKITMGNGIGVISNDPEVTTTSSGSSSGSSGSYTGYPSSSDFGPFTSISFTSNSCACPPTSGSDEDD